MGGAKYCSASLRAIGSSPTSKSSNGTLGTRSGFAPKKSATQFAARFARGGKTQCTGSIFLKSEFGALSGLEPEIVILMLLSGHLAASVTGNRLCRMDA